VLKVPVNPKFISIDERPVIGSQPNLASRSEVVSLYNFPPPKQLGFPPNMGAKINVKFFTTFSRLSHSMPHISGRTSKTKALLAKLRSCTRFDIGRCINRSKHTPCTGLHDCSDTVCEMPFWCALSALADTVCIGYCVRWAISVTDSMPVMHGRTVPGWQVMQQHWELTEVAQ